MGHQLDLTWGQTNYWWRPSQDLGCRCRSWHINWPKLIHLAHLWFNKPKISKIVHILRWRLYNFESFWSLNSNSELFAEKRANNFQVWKNTLSDSNCLKVEIRFNLVHWWIWCWWKYCGGWWHWETQISHISYWCSWYTVVCILSWSK